MEKRHDPHEAPARPFRRQPRRMVAVLRRRMGRVRGDAVSELLSLIDKHGTATAAEHPHDHNQPPVELTPFQKIEKEILDLYQQARDYLDGEPIATKGQADDVGALLNLTRAAAKKADAARTEEKAPLDQKIAEIQARYNALIGDTKAVRGKTVLATEACKTALAPWLKAVQAEIDTEAAQARKEADEKAQLAQEALRASDAANLAQREAAEALVAEARKADAHANRTEKATAVAGHAGQRSIGLRTVWTFTLDSPAQFGDWLWANRRDEYLAFLNEAAKRAVDSGLRDVTGLTIKSEQKAV